MTNCQYIDFIKQGHFLYWNMLGELTGIVNHKENGLMWLSGDVDYNYFTETSDVEKIAVRMKNEEIPKNLLFLTDSFDTRPNEPFLATGLFNEGEGSIGMAHELMDTALPKPDRRLNIFCVSELSHLKMTGSILNAAFEYDLFSFEHYAQMMQNAGQFFYLAEYDGLPVGACMSQHGEKFINISWVATLPGYRKRGIAGYLIQAAERDGIKCGKTISVLNSAPKAVGAYRRVGFREYYHSKDAFLIA